MVWWVTFGWLPDAYQAALSLAHLSRTGGENKMKKLIEPIRLLSSETS